MQILVVEDEALIAAFIEKGLRAEGHAVSVETRGDRVLDRIVVEQPDVVLLDVMLPGHGRLRGARRHPRDGSGAAGDHGHGRAAR